MVGDVVTQQRNPLVFGQRVVVLVDAERGVDLIDRSPVNAGVLADIQAREVKAKHLDLADHIVEIARRGELPGTVDQRSSDHP